MLKISTMIASIFLGSISFSTYAVDQAKATDLQNQKAEIIAKLEQSKQKFTKDLQQWQNSITAKDIKSVNGKETLSLDKATTGCNILQQSINDIDTQFNKIRVLAHQTGGSTEGLLTRTELVKKMAATSQDFEKYGMKCQFK